MYAGTNDHETGHNFQNIEQFVHFGLSGSSAMIGFINDNASLNQI